VVPICMEEGRVVRESVWRSRRVEDRILRIMARLLGMEFVAPRCVPRALNSPCTPTFSVAESSLIASQDTGALAPRRSSPATLCAVCFVSLAG
jgi:hypothetical protein